MQTNQDDGTHVIALMVIAPIVFVLVLAVFGGLGRDGFSTRYDEQILSALSVH